MDVYEDDDSSEYISDGNAPLLSGGVPGLAEKLNSFDREFRKNDGGVRVSRNLRAFQKSDPTFGAHQSSGSGNADVHAEADSSQYDANDDHLFYSSSVTNIFDNSNSVDREFRNDDPGSRVARNPRKSQKSAPPPGAHQDPVSGNADVDSSEYASDDHDLLYSSGMTGLLDDSKLVDWEFRNDDGGVRVSRNLRPFQNIAPSDIAGVHADSDSSEHVSDDPGHTHEQGRGRRQFQTG